MPRSYEVRPKAVVTITDDNEVKVEVDLINLPWEMENDYLAGHAGEQVEADVQRVKDAFMESPLNHTVFTTLHTG